MSRHHHSSNFLSLFVVTLCSKLSSGFPETHPHLQTEDSFIINLVNHERFSECNLVLLQDRYESDDSADLILSRTTSTPSGGIKSLFSIKYKFPMPSELENIDSELKAFGFKLAPGNEDLAKASISPTTLPVRYPVRTTASYFRKLSDQCMVVILMLNDIRPEFMKQIYNLLTPVYIPITRKDEDFYIFKTDPIKHSELLSMKELPSRTKFKLAIGMDENDKLVINTVCFFCEPGGKPRQVQLPVSGRNEILKGVDYFPDFVWDLNGKLLFVAFSYMRAKAEVHPPWEGVANAWRGHWKLLFEKFLTVKFNFTYSMFAATGADGRKGGGGTGVLLDNGTWTGVMGDIIRGKADLGFTIINTPKRIHYIGFTNSFYDVGHLTFVTSQPTAVYSPAALTWPFDLTMWIAILVATVVSILFFFAVFKSMEWLGYGGRENWSITTQIQFLLSSFLEQDSPVLGILQTHGVRCFVCFWIFFTMVLTNVYRCILVTILLFPTLGTIPQTFKELAFSGYKFGFMRHGDSAYNTLAISTDPVYVKLVAEMEIFRDMGLGCIEKAVRGGYGCIAYEFSLEHIIQKNLSDADTRKLSFAPVTAYNSVFGLGCEAKSILRINFGKMLAYTRSFHLADIWNRWDMYYKVRKPKIEWWKATNQTDKLKHAPEPSDLLSLKHVAGAFYVLIACLLVCSVIFVYELVATHVKEVHRRVVFQVWAAKNAVKVWKKMAFNNGEVEEVATQSEEFVVKTKDQ